MQTYTYACIFIHNLYVLVNHFETCVGHECCRNLDAVLCLVVLQQGSHDTGQSQSRAIQCVTEFCLLGLAVTIAALQTVGLIGVEV